jgi:PIN domain nuclease of toxin-antitoxin system
MKYLLDTCILLFALEGNRKKLGPFADLIENSCYPLFVSTVSYWEIMIKKSLGRIQINGDLKEYMQESGFLWLSLELRHIDFLQSLPSIHQDPFDRILVAQSKVDKLKILTIDEKILSYFDEKGNKNK